MRNLIVRVVVPASIILFVLVTRWWNALPEDAPDTRYWGFPLVFMGHGWHTSLSLQIFVLEMVADFLCYFIIVLSLLIGINRFFMRINSSRRVGIGMWIAAVLLLLPAIFILCIGDNLYHLTRSYKMEIMESGWQFYYW